MICMVRKLVLVNFYMLQYSHVCSSMMTVHPKGGGFVQDTRLSLINVGIVFVHARLLLDVVLSHGLYMYPAGGENHV